MTDDLTLKPFNLFDRQPKIPVENWSIKASDSSVSEKQRLMELLNAFIKMNLYS
jgi:hypothetical protein